MGATALAARRSPEEDGTGRRRRPLVAGTGPAKGEVPCVPVPAVFVTFQLLKTKNEHDLSATQDEKKGA